VALNNRRRIRTFFIVWVKFESNGIANYAIFQSKDLVVCSIKWH